MRKLLQDIGKSVDVILIDTPPMLAASGPLMIAANAGEMLLVGRGGKTRTEAQQQASAARRQQWRAGAAKNGRLVRFGNTLALRRRLQPAAARWSSAVLSPGSPRAFR